MSKAYRRAISRMVFPPVWNARSGLDSSWKADLDKNQRAEKSDALDLNKSQFGSRPLEQKVQ
jgi:hypothetical protein